MNNINSILNIVNFYVGNPCQNITKIKGRKEFCDDEIKGYKDPVAKKLLNNKWRKQFDKWNKTETNITKGSENSDIQKIKAVLFECDNNKLMVIDAEYKELPDNICIFVLITDVLFVVVGVIGAHPMVETNNMTYGNSDGSGPEIIKDEYFEDGDEALDALIYWYFEFTADKYH